MPAQRQYQQSAWLARVEPLYDNAQAVSCELAQVQQMGVHSAWGPCIAHLSAQPG